MAALLIFSGAYLVVEHSVATLDAKLPPPAQEHVLPKQTTGDENQPDTPAISMRAAFDAQNHIPIFDPLRGKQAVETVEQDLEEPNPQPAAPPPEAPAPPAVRFVGFLAQVGSSQALLERQGSTEQIWVSVDDIVDNWVVRNIDATVIEFAHQSFEFSLEILRE